MKKIVVLSGAGISAESGIQTFRDTNGLWENYAIEEVATPEAWRRNPDLVTEFYNLRRKQVVDAQPNTAHLFFADLEKQFDVQVVTQNIDDLHERAGSSKVLHLHGNIRLAKSSGPNQEKKYYPLSGTELTKNDLCDDGYRLRPHVVWFGEEVPALQQAAELVGEADILVVVGTSLNVYPAAGLIHAAKNSCRCYAIDPNAGEIGLSNRFTAISDTACNGVQQLLKYLND